MTAAPQYRLWVGRELYEFPRSLLNTDIETRHLVDRLELSMKANRIRHFTLIEATDHPGSDALAMLNDTVSDLKILRGPNGGGKTAVTMIDVLLSLIPCDPSWEIFTKYGVKWREWEGPKVAVFCNYKMQHHKQHTWKELQKWIPRAELGGYVQKNSKGRLAKTPSWDRDPHIDLKCGSQIFFKAYEQDQDSFESFAADIFHWSEQGQEAKFNGADERVRRRSGRHVFDLTPHKVEGRPDTGWGSWIHKIETGENEMGHIVGRYRMGIDDVPAWVLTPEMKAAAYEKWVAGPQRSNNIKDLREGRARYYGEWHTTAGLVYDEIDPDVHFIEPFEITDEFTLYRGLDHGSKNPTACLSWAVDAEGFCYAFREYYQRGQGIFTDVRNIVEAAGNELVARGTFKNAKSGIQYDRFEEKMVREVYFKSVLDSRSFATEEASLPIGKLYNIAGLHVVPASGLNDAQGIPLVKEMLRINPLLKNPITGKMGSPRIFFFKTLAQFRREWMSFVWVESKNDDKNPVEKARDKDNHLVGSALKYSVQIPMRYMGSMVKRGVPSTGQTSRGYVNATTGY